MGDKLNNEYFATSSPAFNYNNVTGGGDSASGGSGGSGMECMQPRSPGPFHYLISEQAKSLVALQELQNEVGALLEFRDLVIETFPNLRSKMAPSTPANSRRDWEPGVRVRRKLANGSGETARGKPQPSVQDSGFSTETSCGKDAHSSASASASASRSRPVEDELWALLDVIQRKGARLREEAEVVRGELGGRHAESTAEESFLQVLEGSVCAQCADTSEVRAERDALAARVALAGRRRGGGGAQAGTEQAGGGQAGREQAGRAPPPGRLDAALGTPPRPPHVPSPDSHKIAAILQESNPVELQRQLLTSTIQNQVLNERLKSGAALRSNLMQQLERARDQNDDLKFRLEEKNIELEGARARLRQLETGESRAHSSMRDMEPLALPGEGPGLGSGPAPASGPGPGSGPDAPAPGSVRRRPSRIPLHTAHKGAAPRPPSAHSVHSARSSSLRSEAPKPPLRRPPPHDNKKCRQVGLGSGEESLFPADGAGAPRAALLEYLARTERLAPLFPRLHTVRARPLPTDLLLNYRLAYETPQNLALELSKSILYENSDSIDIKNLKSINSHGEDSLWNGKPQQYFESINFSDQKTGEADIENKGYETDSLAP